MKTNENIRKLVEQGREKLPLPSESDNNEIIIPVAERSEVDIDFPFYSIGCHVRIREVRFRKQIIAGLIVGWEFTSIN